MLICYGNFRKVFSQYVGDDNLKLTDDVALQQGQQLLRHVFGGWQEQQLSQQAVEETGLDSGTLGKMMPIIVLMLMEVLVKKARNKSFQSSLFLHTCKS